MKSYYILILSIVSFFSCSTKENTVPKESEESPKRPIILVEDDRGTAPSSTIDSSKVVTELPPYEGKVTYSDKRLHIKSTGVNIASNLIDDDGMRSQKLFVSDPRSGTKRSYVFEGEDAIGWLLPGNKEDIIYVVPISGNRNGFSLIEFNISSMEPGRDLIQGIGIFALIQKDSCFEIRLDGPLEDYNGTNGAWTWLERYDLDGNLQYSGDSLFVLMEH